MMPEIMVRVQGDSMVDAEVNDGDYVKLLYNQTPRSGDIVMIRRTDPMITAFYFRCAPTFEAPADSKYGWLNNSLFLCAPEFSQGFNGIVLNVWKVN